MLRFVLLRGVALCLLLRLCLLCGGFASCCVVVVACFVCCCASCCVLRLLLASCLCAVASCLVVCFVVVLGVCFVLRWAGFALAGCLGLRCLGLGLVASLLGFVFCVCVLLLRGCVFRVASCMR